MDEQGIQPRLKLIADYLIQIAAGMVLTGAIAPISAMVFAPSTMPHPVMTVLFVVTWWSFSGMLVWAADRVSRP